MRNTQVALLGRKSLAREGLRRILEEKEFDVVRSSDKASVLLDLDLGEIDQPLIILIDHSSIKYDRDELLAITDRTPRAKLVHLVEKFDLDDVIVAFKSGAQGYILKDIRCESLIASLQLIALGEKILPAELIEQLPVAPHSNGAGQNDLHDILSDREIQILRYLAAGFPNKVIAKRLGLSEAAVKVHVKGILRKLNVNNRTQAAVLAFNRGLGLAVQDGDTDEDGVAARAGNQDGATRNASAPDGDNWPRLANVA